jgi:nucleoside-diphosphate-sugar epimerase
MNMKRSNTIIFGKRSNLSIALDKHLENSLLVSGEEYFDRTFDLKLFQDTPNLQIIINSFYPSTMLNNITNPKKYITDSIYLLASILEDIKILEMKNISKIVYTSSASVYGNNPRCKESDTPSPQNLYGSLKFSSEKLLESFCATMEIDYTIARIFNMYGGDDHFSIISKILQSAQKQDPITVVNNGQAIRDFVHIDDVVKTYITLLQKKDIHCVNIANGVGISIQSIIDSIEKTGIILQKEYINRNEINTSIASVDLLSNCIDIDSFIQVDDYVTKILSNSSQ